MACTLPHIVSYFTVFHPSPPLFPPAQTEDLLCFKASDKSRRCWRRCVRNWPVTDLWLWVYTTRNDEALSGIFLFVFFFLLVCLHLHTHIPAQTPGCIQTQHTLFLQKDNSVRTLEWNSFFLFIPSSSPSSSIQTPASSKVRTSGSGWNIWVCWGHGDRGLQTLTEFSAALSDFLWSLCIHSLMSTTVQIPETLLDFPNHIIVSQHATLREREREGEEREGSCFLENVWSVSR